MKYIKISIILAVIFSLFGCDTTNTPCNQRKNLPNNMVYAYDQKTEERTATITVTRDEGTLGYFCKIGLYINTQLAGRFSTKETKQFYVKPGKVLLKAIRDPYGKGICNWKCKDTNSQQEIFIKRGENKFYRIRTASCGIYIQQTNR